MTREEIVTAVYAMLPFAEATRADAERIADLIERVRDEAVRDCDLRSCTLANAQLNIEKREGNQLSAHACREIRDNTRMSNRARFPSAFKETP